MVVTLRYIIQQSRVVLTLAGKLKPPKSTINRILLMCHLTFRVAIGLPEREYSLVGHKPIIRYTPNKGAEMKVSMALD